MKFATVLYCAISAASVSAVAIPEPDAAFTKLKRAAEAAADALAEPAEGFQRYCHLPGQSCWKTKRAADAFAEAIADAFAAADAQPEAEAHMKRYAAAMPEPDPAAEAEALALAEAIAQFPRYCHLPGMSCPKTKRNPAPQFPRYCHMGGKPTCPKNEKRDAEAHAAALAEATADFPRYCHLPGQSCWKVKRAAEAVAEALAQPEAEAVADVEGHWLAVRAAEALELAARTAVAEM